MSASAISPDRMADLKARLRQLLAASGKWQTVSELLKRKPGKTEGLIRAALCGMVAAGEVEQRPATRLRKAWGHHGPAAGPPQIPYKVVEYALVRGEKGSVS